MTANSVVTERTPGVNPYELTIDRSKYFDPSAFTGNKDLKIWCGPKNESGLHGPKEQDQKSLLVDRIDFSGFTKQGNFLNGLRAGEDCITGEINRWRLIRHSIQADARIAEELFKQEGQQTLRLFYDSFGIENIEFLGTVLRSPRGRRCSLHLYRRTYNGSNGSWFYYYSWLGYPRGAKSFVLTLFKKSLVRRPWGAAVPK
jgi:hypothetical protein